MSCILAAKCLGRLSCYIFTQPLSSQLLLDGPNLFLLSTLYTFIPLTQCLYTPSPLPGRFEQRDPYVHHLPWRSEECFSFGKYFKITKSYLNGERAYYMKLPQVNEDANCGIHPCCASKDGCIPLACHRAMGNIDIAPLLKLLCRQLSIPMPLRGWQTHRHKFNYGNFIETTLAHDRLFEIFPYAKRQTGGRNGC